MSCRSSSFECRNIMPGLEQLSTVDLTQFVVLFYCLTGEW